MLKLEVSFGVAFVNTADDGDTVVESGGSDGCVWILVFVVGETNAVGGVIIGFVARHVLIASCFGTEAAPTSVFVVSVSRAFCGHGSVLIVVFRRCCFRCSRFIHVCWIDRWVALLTWSSNHVN